jgi:hypothetical protein
MVRSFRCNGRKPYGTGTSWERPDHARRPSGNTAIASFARDAEPGTRDYLSIAPAAKPPIDCVPVAKLGRNIAPRRAAAKPPEYSVDDRPVLFGRTTAPSLRRINRQQACQNTPFRFVQIAPAQARLQKAAMNPALRFASTNLSTPPRRRRLSAIPR